MKSNLARCLYATSMIAAITGGPVAAQTTLPPEGPSRGPMQPHHHPDGSMYRLRNTIVTAYWSGYAATASAPYSSASGTFQVPSVTVDGLANSTEYASEWVGIGGYSDSTLIQLGSYEAVSPSGATGYYVWYELYPAPTHYIPHTVKPGDIITASLQCTAACSPGSVQTWQLTMTDATAGWSWTTSVSYQSSMASAEWILEAPWFSSGEVPLANFAQATFDPVEANGLNPNLSLSANGIVMQDPYGETSNPSSPVNGDIFTTCWGKGSLAPCTAGSFASSPKTTASLSANPKSITAGQSSTLTWSSTNATSCKGQNFNASRTSGSAVVFPTVTTSYSVTCTGAGGPATAMATVTRLKR
jgi:Peptidase A4 family